LASLFLGEENRNIHQSSRIARNWAEKPAGIKFTHIFAENPEINQLSQGQLHEVNWLQFKDD
jgi:hypothetical protein